MDNDGQKDFPVPVQPVRDPLSLVVTAFSTGDSDLSYWTGNTAASTTLLVGRRWPVWAGLASAVNWRIRQHRHESRTAALVSGNVNSLLIAASLINADCVKDYIKVGSLTVDSAPVPEPGTMGLLGLALAGLGVMRMRKRG